MFGFAFEKGPLHSALAMCGTTAADVLVLCALHNLHHSFTKNLIKAIIELLSKKGRYALQLQLDKYVYSSNHRHEETNTASTPGLRVPM